MEMTTAQPVAGWYTDPADSANERWWGGLDWTDHVRPLAVASTPSYQPADPIPAPAPVPQLAVPSSRAAHAAPAQHVADSPFTTPVAATQPAAPSLDTVATPVVAPTPAFTAPPVFSLTTPEPVLAATSVAPPAPAAFTPPPAPAFTPPPAPVFTAPPAPVAMPLAAEPVAQPQAATQPQPVAQPQAAEPQLPPPSLSTLVLTPAPAPIAIAPIAAAAGTAVDESALATEASIPQYASQLQPASDSLLGMTGTSWDALAATPGPSLYSPTSEVSLYASTPEQSLYASVPPPSLYASTTAPSLYADTPAPSLYATPPTAAPANTYPLAQAAPLPGTAVAISGPTPTTGFVSGYQPTPVKPTNGTAIVGFLFSFFGFALIGLFVSISALRKAREFESRGMRPVGRVLARWGVAIATISFVLSIALGAIFGIMGPDVLRYLPAGMLTPATTYSQSAYEATLLTDITSQTGEAPQSVRCPATASMTAGSVIDCNITMADGVEGLMRTTFLDDGTRTIEQIA